MTEEAIMSTIVNLQLRESNYCIALQKVTANMFSPLNRYRIRSHLVANITVVTSDDDAPLNP